MTSELRARRGGHVRLRPRPGLALPDRRVHHAGHGAAPAGSRLLTRSSWRRAWPSCSAPFILGVVADVTGVVDRLAAHPGHLRGLGAAHRARGASADERDGCGGCLTSAKVEPRLGGGKSTTRSTARWRYVCRSSVVEISTTTPRRRSRMSHSQTSKTRQSASSSCRRLRASRSRLSSNLRAQNSGLDLGRSRVAARAVVPVAAVHEDGDAAARVRDVGSTRRALPVQPIAGMAGLTERRAKLPLRLGVPRPVGLHDRPHGRRRRRRVGQLQSGHGHEYLTVLGCSECLTERTGSTAGTASLAQILERATRMPGRSLGELVSVAGLDRESSRHTKGSVGAAVEAYFGLPADSVAEPDFRAAWASSSRRSRFALVMTSSRSRSACTSR